MNKKVVAYIRVSTEEQAEHGYSIDVQKQVLEDYSSGHALDVVATFVESESAFKPGRREFARMIELLEKNKAIGAVLVYKIDRIARNMLDYTTLVEKMGLDIISATEELPRNATGRLMGDMQAAFSRYFSAQLSDRVSEAMAAKAKKGIYPSYAPVGYTNDTETRTIVRDSERASLVAEAFEIYGKTEITLADLVKWSKSRGLTTRKGGNFAKSTIHKMLINPIYAGVVRWADVTAVGIHEPLISQFLFDRVQEKLHDRGQGRRERTHSFAFRGFLTCGYCGCQITASKIKGKYVYYHCTKGRGKCRQPYVRQESLSQRLESIVDNVRVPEDIVRKLLDEIQKGEVGREERTRSRLKELDSERKKITTRRDQAYLDKQDGVLGMDRWRELEDGWANRTQLITQQEQRLKSSLGTPGVNRAQETFELLERASQLYLKQSPDEQASGLKILVSNCKLKGKSIEPNYRKPFDLVAEGVKTGIWYPQEDSNLALNSQQ